MVEERASERLDEILIEGRDSIRLETFYDLCRRWLKISLQCLYFKRENGGFGNLLKVFSKSSQSAKTITLR